jgi:hypothetical protein
MSGDPGYQLFAGAVMKSIDMVKIQERPEKELPHTPY